MVALFDLDGSKIAAYNTLKHPHPEFRYLIFYKAFRSLFSEAAQSDMDIKWKESRDLGINLLGLFQLYFPNNEMDDKANVNYIDGCMEQYQIKSYELFEKLVKHRIVLPNGSSEHAG